VANDKKYYWLKLKKDFFKRHDIQIIEAMDNGKDYILFYLKLLVESVDHDGYLKFNDTIPYNEKMLATITNTNIDVVRSAMKIFVSLDMMEILEDKTIFMNEVQKMVGTETYWAEQKRKQKLKKLHEQEFKYIKKLSYEQLQLPNGKVQYVDNKRYGGNAFIAFERAEGKCQICGTYENLCIHHMHGYSNELSDLMVLCRKCHRDVEESNAPTEFGKFPPKVLNESNMSKQEKEKEIDKDIEIDKERDKEENSLSDKTLEILKFYEEKTSINISSQYQLIFGLAELYDIADIKEAISKSLGCGKKGKGAIDYAKGILKNWASEGKEEKHGTKQDNKSDTSELYDFSKFGG
jgi:predicted phage replisome organizer